MQWLNRQDYQWLLFDTPTNPLVIGALLEFEVDPIEENRFFDQIKKWFTQKILGGPLAVIYQSAPLGFDSGAWRNVANIDFDKYITRIYLQSCTHENEKYQIFSLVSKISMCQFNLELCPFRIFVFDKLFDGKKFVLLQVHHALADGIGFQNILYNLTTDSSEKNLHDEIKIPLSDEPLISSPAWLTKSSIHFFRQSLNNFKQFLHLYQNRAPEASSNNINYFRNTPHIPNLSGPSSCVRSYSTTSFQLDDFKKIGKILGGTVNDVFMAVCGGALRLLLIELNLINNLTNKPLIGLTPRSLRGIDSPLYGNFISATLPQLGTDIDDAIERFYSVKKSMQAQIEINRKNHASIKLTHDLPFANILRRKKNSSNLAPGNVSISNIQGPEEYRYMAGHRIIFNYPTPGLPAGHFLSIILRRHNNSLCIGVMTDAKKLSDANKIINFLHKSYADLISRQT